MVNDETTRHARNFLQRRGLAIVEVTLRTQTPRVDRFRPLTFVTGLNVDVPVTGPTVRVTLVGVEDDTFGLTAMALPDALLLMARVAVWFTVNATHHPLP